MVWADRAGEFIIIRTANRTTSEVWLVDARSPTIPARRVAERRPGIEYSVGHQPGSAGGWLLIVTNEGANEFRLMRAPVSQSARWEEVVAEIPGERIHEVEVFAGHIVLATVRDSRQWLRLLPWAALEEPDPLSQSKTVDAGVPGGLLNLGHNEEFDVDSILVEVESYLIPLTWQTVELSTGRRQQIRQHPVPNYDSDQYVLEERWVTARDGEAVPIRLVRHVDTALDGSAPLCLYGYGAYESSFWPGFEIALLSLLDRGVVFVHAGIRGGGEMGRRWWLEGRMETKLNTFTDFIDVADIVIRGCATRSRSTARSGSPGRRSLRASPPTSPRT
jgi:oligopeptidase B